MKTMRFKTLASCLLLGVAGMQAYAQATEAPMTPIEQGGKKPTQKLSKNEVPKEVIDAFVVDYPAVVYYNWYGYPVLVEETDWYLLDSTAYTTSSPEYYVTEFVTNEVPQKVMYNKSGKKVAMYKNLKGNCPKEVTEALNRSVYKNWKLLNEKEEISEGKGQAKIYKLTVQKDNEKHLLYYRSNGTLLKDKKMKM
jgi:hypothetical protein